MGVTEGVAVAVGVGVGVGVGVCDCADLPELIRSSITKQMKVRKHRRFVLQCPYFEKFIGARPMLNRGKLFNEMTNIATPSMIRPTWADYRAQIIQHSLFGVPDITL